MTPIQGTKTIISSIFQIVNTKIKIFSSFFESSSGSIKPELLLNFYQ